MAKYVRMKEGGGGRRVEGGERKSERKGREVRGLIAIRLDLSRVQLLLILCDASHCRSICSSEGPVGRPLCYSESHQWADAGLIRAGQGAGARLQVPGDLF